MGNDYIEHLINRALKLLENNDVSVLYDIKNASEISIFRINEDGDFYAAPNLNIEKATFILSKHNSKNNE